MRHFKPCPITGGHPNRGMDGERLVRWWNDTYIPALKLAEQQEPEWEPQVGDVVTLSEDGLWFCFRHAEKSNGITKACVEENDDGLVTLNEKFFLDDHLKWDKSYLRLISRPKQLTVADLPEIDGITWTAHGKPGLPVMCIQMSQSGYSEVIKEFGGQSEHEAVTAALDFCRKIADGMKKLEVGDE